MATPNADNAVIAATNQYNISSRGALNMISRDIWGPRVKQMSKPWSLTNPDGVIILRLAENSLMHDEICDFVRTQIQVEPTSHLTYSTGPKGSLRMREAAAALLTHDFRAQTSISADDIFVTPGLASSIDALAWAICNDGEGIMIPRPFYNGFTFDLLNRSGTVIVGVEYQGLEDYSGFDDLFDPKVNRKALEATLKKARLDGISIRALMISNPHNPLGRCYPEATLKEMVVFCSKNGLHFISDEIYANSVFENPNLPRAIPFTSVLALNLESSIDPNLVHVLYGASKDFCANGLRLGFLYSKNIGVLGSVSSNSQFSWCPHVLQDVWAAMLEDRSWRQHFFAQSHKQIAEQYLVATQFLKEKGIGYYESNAAVFIWCDFRRFLLSKPVTDHNVLRTTSPGSDVYQQREKKVMDICAANGVLIAPGAVYGSEEYGWFRITFTVSRGALEEGLRRLWRSLKQIEETGWQNFVTLDKENRETLPS